MKVTLTALLRDAWQLWRRDYDVLSAIAGPFLFLPVLGLLLLAPQPPDPPAGMTTEAALASSDYMHAVAAWLVGYLPWWSLSQLTMVFGLFATVALYVSRDRAAVGGALLAALRRLPLLFVALLVVAVPVMAVSMIVVLAPILLPLHIVVVTLAVGRSLLIMPALHAEPGIGAVGAVRRSLAATHRNTLILGGAVLTIYAATIVGVWPFAAIERWMADAPNPVARAIVDAVQALVIASSWMATALLQVAAWRRLSGRA